MLRNLALGSLVALLLGATHAAAAQRTFVRSDGIDSNPCTLQQPCRGFAAAILLTDPNGEIVVLDSAGYGSVTVTKAVSIIAPPGVYAGISVFAAQDGVTVNAGATDKVALRGLAINGQGGNRGIVVTAARRGAGRELRHREHGKRRHPDQRWQRDARRAQHASARMRRTAFGRPRPSARCSSKSRASPTTRCAASSRSKGPSRLIGPPSRTMVTKESRCNRPRAWSASPSATA